MIARRPPSPDGGIGTVVGGQPVVGAGGSTHGPGLASGRPVVATCAEGTELARVVQDRGLIVPPGDADALVEAIRTLAGDEELRICLGDNARAYAEEHLSRDVVLARFERALEELLTQGD